MKKKPKYKRTVLFENKDVEAILIDWEPGAETPIHDHGNSYGLIRVLRGALTEEVFLIRDSFPLILYSHVFYKDKIVTEFPEGVHRMKNSGTTKAQSLHIYTPPLVMREYKEKKGAER